jgi:hypothetical protein
MEQKRIRHAIVNQDNVVVNVVIWNGAPWQPPVNHYVVQNDTVSIGDIYDHETNSFKKPQQ